MSAFTPSLCFTHIQNVSLAHTDTQRAAEPICVHLTLSLPAPVLRSPLSSRSLRAAFLAEQHVTLSSVSRRARVSDCVGASCSVVVKRGSCFIFSWWSWQAPFSWRTTSNTQTPFPCTSRASSASTRRSPTVPWTGGEQQRTAGARVLSGSCYPHYNREYLCLSYMSLCACGKRGSTLACVMHSLSGCIVHVCFSVWERIQISQTLSRTCLSHISHLNQSNSVFECFRFKCYIFMYIFTIF